MACGGRTDATRRAGKASIGIGASCVLRSHGSESGYPLLRRRLHLAVVANNISFDVLGDFASGKIHGLTDVAFLFDGVFFAEDNDTRFVRWAGLFVKQAKSHDR